LPGRTHVVDLSDPVATNDVADAEARSRSISRRSDPTRMILDILDLARALTDAEVAFVGEFKDQRQIYRWVAGDASSFGIRAGAGVPLADTYGYRMSIGAIPNMIPDVAEDARTRDLPFTAKAGVGSYLGIPIWRREKELFGTLCVLSHEPRPALHEDHQRYTALLGRLISEQIELSDEQASDRRRRFEIVKATIDAARSIKVAFQPIVALQAGRIVGYEALARFSDGRPPDQWLADAGRVDLAREVEIAMVHAALERIDELPRDAFVAINVSPRTLLDPAFEPVLDDAATGRLVIELTEHEEVHDYRSLRAEIERLRRRGVKVAVDDLGSGFSTLRHVLQVSPDLLKLDVWLTRGIDHDPARAALASLFVSFGAHIGASVIAEGIEDEEERKTLASLGVQMGQGFLLGVPSQNIQTHPLSANNGSAP
jgi:EAL domain-containing protein (putative c-di-GMP-specific phosphodiesterase class I)